MFTPTKESSSSPYAIRAYEPMRFNDTYSIHNTVLGTPDNKIQIKAFDGSIKVKMKTLKGVATNGMIRY